MKAQSSGIAGLPIIMILIIIVIVFAFALGAFTRNLFGSLIPLNSAQITVFASDPRIFNSGNCRFSNGALYNASAKPGTILFIVSDTIPNDCFLGSGFNNVPVYSIGTTQAMIGTNKALVVDPTLIWNIGYGAYPVGPWVTTSTSSSTGSSSTGTTSTGSSSTTTISNVNYCILNCQNPIGIVINPIIAILKYIGFNVNFIA